MRRSKLLCLWLCLAHAAGGWAGVHWPLPFAERVHQQFFSLTALALAEVHRADDARREELLRCGFPAQSAGAQGNRLGEVMVACIAEQPGAPYPFVFEDNDSFVQIIDRTKRRLQHERNGFGPFGKFQVNREEARPLFADDVIDRIQKLSPEARACVERAWAEHKERYGTNLSFNPLLDDGVRQRMLRLELWGWLPPDKTIVSMPLPVTLPAPSVNPQWFERLFWPVAMIDDDTPDTRDLYHSGIKYTLYNRLRDDACAHAHLHRAACAMENEPTVNLGETIVRNDWPLYLKYSVSRAMEKHRYHIDVGAAIVQGNAPLLLTDTLSQAIGQTRLSAENFGPMETYKWLCDWLASDPDPAAPTGTKPRNALAEMLLALEQQRCDRPHAQLDEACTQASLWDIFDF